MNDVVLTSNEHTQTLEISRAGNECTFRLHPNGRLEVFTNSDGTWPTLFPAEVQELKLFLDRHTHETLPRIPQPESDMRAAYERWLDEPWEEKDNRKDHLWLAFKAGAMGKPAPESDVLARIHVELSRGHTTVAFEVATAAINGQPLPGCVACTVANMVRVDDGSQKAIPQQAAESILDRKVTVCASCLCASCWQGEFYCDNYKTASTVDKTVRELFQINANGVREDSGYWFKDVNTGKVDYDAKSAAKREYNAQGKGE